MKHGVDSDRLLVCAIEDRVRKSRRKRAAELAVHHRSEQRVLLNPREAGVKGSKEVVPESALSLLIPRIGGADVALGLGLETQFNCYCRGESGS